MRLFCFKSVFYIAILSVVSLAGHAQWNPSTDHLRVYLGAGPRNINDTVMESAAWDFAREVGMSIYRADTKKQLYYGLEAFSNNAWDSRIDQTSQISGRFLQTVIMHNSSSLDILGYAGKHQGDWSADIGFGAQFAWVKWLNTIPAVDNKLRVVPKLRVSLNRDLTERAALFLAFNQAFNVYGSPLCATPNCLNEDGYVDVSDLKLGVSFII